MDGWTDGMCLQYSTVHDRIMAVEFVLSVTGRLIAQPISKRAEGT